MDFRNIIIAVPPLLFSIVLHEFAHAWSANKLGDPTARLQGRVTLNPLVHIDPFLSILLPGILILSGSPIIFGGAKPVPVDARYFKNHRRDSIIVTLAGPLSNVFLAIVLLIIANLVGIHNLIGQNDPAYQELLAGWIFQGVLINVVLACFNMIPIPPLDGGRILINLLPLNAAYFWSKLEPYGFFIIIILLYLGIIDLFLGPIIRYSISLLGLPILIN